MTANDAAHSTAGIRDALSAEIPSLRAFARSLCRNADEADDLVQETLLKALGALDKFTPGTNLRAWLFTILRNTFYSARRKSKRETLTEPEVVEAKLASKPEQDGRMDMRDFQQALFQLPEDQREALMLVGAAGVSYEDAAEICGCAIGTIKSRVNRARSRLAELMDVESSDDLGSDAVTTAVVEHVVSS